MNFQVQPVRRPPSSGWCITSLILGILGLCNGITAIPAVICGHIGLSKIKKSAGRLGGGGLAIAGVTMGYIGTIGLVILVALLSMGAYGNRKKNAEAEQLFDLSAARTPTLPARPEFEPLGDKGVSFAAVQISDGEGPGESMWMRVYLPPGTHAPGSLSAVLVAPAGTNLTSGADLGPPGDGEYHDECLPYAEAGMAVVFYSLDGEVDDDAEPETVEAGYKAFEAACGGVVNGRNALEFVLARLPEVDSQRIFSAGHSSAGTVSLLLGQHEPRLAGSLAYAPAADVEKQLEETLETPMIEMILPGVEYFAKRSSPITHVFSVTKPMFLFHAEDDEIVPIEDTRAFVARLEDEGKDVTFEEADDGGHYYPMIEYGIPAGIEWIRGR